MLDFGSHVVLSLLTQRTTFWLQFTSNLPQREFIFTFKFMLCSLIQNFSVLWIYWRTFMIHMCGIFLYLMPLLGVCPCVATESIYNGKIHWDVKYYDKMHWYAKKTNCYSILLLVVLKVDVCIPKNNIRLYIWFVIDISNKIRWFHRRIVYINNKIQKFSIIDK
jgi:hypothetical protein